MRVASKGVAESSMELFLVRTVTVVLVIVSVVGFLNAFYWRHDGLAAVLAVGAFLLSRHIQKNG